MSNDNNHDTSFIRAWTTHEVLLETHQYAPGPAGTTVSHAHDMYQLCLSLDFPGEYRYRGASLPVPVGSLSIIHPGEVHAARDPIPRTTVSTYRMFYLAPELLRQPITELASRPANDPFFAQPILTDAALVASWMQLHLALEAGATLAAHTLLAHALAQLVARYASEPLHARAPLRARSELLRVREYIHGHPAARITLDELAQIAGMSMYQLCRAFGHTFGIPPHRYQTLVRIDHAKRLLASGTTPAHVAIETGFSDQSHFGRHFKQVVGVTPATYAHFHQQHQQRAKTY